MANYKQRDFKGKAKKILLSIFNVLKFAIPIFLVLYLIESTAYRIIGILILVFALPVYRLIQNKHIIKDIMRHLETVIYGKPLEKEFWKKGELKNLKVKMKWGKKK